MRSFIIQDHEAGQRFDKYLKKLLCNAQGSFIYKMLRKKNIVLNGKKADGAEKLQQGDEVKLFLSEETFEKFAGNAETSEEFEALKQIPSGKLPVVYEDVHVLIVNKPSGMLSQKAEASDISANEYILSYLIGKGELTEEMLKTFRPSVCNRLDRNTSGLLTAGKTLQGLQELSKALKERSVQKYYRCIVKGELKTAASLNGWLQKEEAANQVKVYKVIPADRVAGDFSRIETEYQPLQVKGGYTELEVHLITGRTHQIRAHLASIGYPIVGDFKYGEKAVNERFRKEASIRSQLLHAYRMEFPDGNKVIAECGPEFARAWDSI